MRIVRELLLHDDRYLNSSFLCQGIDRVDTTLPAVYAQYSPGYVPGSKLSDADIRNVYERETMSVVRSGAYCCIWQLHELASVVNRPIRSIYPVIGPPKAELCRMLLPARASPPPRASPPGAKIPTIPPTLIIASLGIVHSVTKSARMTWGNVSAVARGCTSTMRVVCHQTCNVICVSRKMCDSCFHDMPVCLMFK